MFARAWESDAHAVVFDMEDAVPPDRKADARDAMLSLQVPDGWMRPVYVRCNPVGTEHFDADIGAVARMTAPLAGVVLPKVERAVDVREADQALAAGMRGEGLALVLFIETPAGVLRLAELVDAGVTRVQAYAFGGEDYRAGLGVDALDPATADFARASVSNAAAAAGVPAIDSPLLRFDDPEALRVETRRARALGFSAKFAIHPSQLGVINEEFAVGGDRAWAQRAVEVYERAAREGRGTAALDGRMIDEATLKRARDILAS